MEGTMASYPASPGLSRSQSLPDGVEGLPNRPTSLPCADAPKVVRRVSAESPPRYIRSVPIALSNSLPPSSSLPDLTTLTPSPSRTPSTSSSRTLDPTLPGTPLSRSVTVDALSTAIAQLNTHASPGLAKRFCPKERSLPSRRTEGMLRRTTMEEVEASVSSFRRRRSSTKPSVVDEAVERDAVRDVTPMQKHVRPSVETLPSNPKSWTPAQLTVYLSHVLKLIPAALIEDIHGFVLERKLYGRTFLSLRERDLCALGINLRWVRVLSEARKGLRRACLQGRFAGYVAEGDGSDSEEEEEGKEGGTSKEEKEARWKASWRKVSAKHAEGRIRGMAKMFEDPEAEEVRNATDAGMGRIVKSSDSVGSSAFLPLLTSDASDAMRPRATSTSSATSSLDFSEGESVLSTDEVDLERVPLVDADVADSASDVAETIEASATEEAERTVAELLQESGEQRTDRENAEYRSSIKVHRGAGLDPYANVTRRRGPLKSPTHSLLRTRSRQAHGSDEEVSALPTVDVTLVDATTSFPDHAFVQPREGGTVKPSLRGLDLPSDGKMPGSLRLRADGGKVDEKALDALFARSGDLLGIVGTLDGKSATSSRSGSVAIVKKSQLREMQARMEEIEARLAALGRDDLSDVDGDSQVGATSPIVDVDADEVRKASRERRQRNVSETSVADSNWGDGSASWQDLGSYVVLASFGVGLAVGQMVLSKIFGVRH